MQPDTFRNGSFALSCLTCPSPHVSFLHSTKKDGEAGMGQDFSFVP